MLLDVRPKSLALRRFLGIRHFLVQAMGILVHALYDEPGHDAEPLLPGSRFWQYQCHGRLLSFGKNL